MNAWLGFGLVVGAIVAHMAWSWWNDEVRD